MTDELKDELARAFAAHAFTQTMRDILEMDPPYPDQPVGPLQWFTPEQIATQDRYMRGT